MRQVDDNYSPVQLEKGIRADWDSFGTYHKVKRAHEEDKPFYFLDGPPYTTGSIHIGTAWNKVLKDTYVRYRRMQGLQVRDQPGFDMHGLPIEVKVEQSLGFKSKKDIESHGIDKFVNKCREFASEFKAKMTEEFKLLGVWMDWDNPYLTVDPAYVASVWWTLKQAHDKNLLTTDLRVLPWCPRCETALAEAEIEYWDETDPSIYVRFPVEGGRDEYLLIWTTTPWTIPGNLAAAVHPDLMYSRVKVKRGLTEETLILLDEKVEELANIAEFDEAEVLETVKGSDLIGMHYRHPLEDLLPHMQQFTGEWVHAVLASETVTAESTGIVHIAPGHGPEDFEIGQAHDLDAFSPVDESGVYTEEAGPRYAGMDVREANALVISDLVERGAMLHQGRLTHRYGHCWRCKRPIIYRVTEQWFLKVTEIKSELDRVNDSVKWYPDWAGSSREKDWISNARDWCISRQRYWGTPLPIWRCQCGNIKVISSVDDLRTGSGYVEGMDVHRPWIDGVTFKCDKCGETMTRTPDVLDVWFDAGVCSWASLGHPAAKEAFEKWWPSDWITEAHDQTRGWFYSQLVTGVVALGESPYKSVLMHGWALNPQGEAMSKSEGTAVDPLQVVNTLGADSLRLYLLKANAPWEDVLFQHEGVKAANRTLNILWNVYKFAVLYMSIDKFDPSAVRLDSIRDELRAEDRWMLSRTEGLKREFTSAMEAYEVHRAARALESYIVEDLSRWYVKLVRDRLWKEGEDRDKIAAFKVLHEALSTSALLLSPIAPYISEAIFTNLNARPESVHMAHWPSESREWRDESLEAGMEMVREISEAVARVRQDANVNLRWPLKRIIVKAPAEEDMEALLQLKDALLSQNNIKELEAIPAGEEWEGLILSVVPNPNAIGKVYRQWASKIAVLLKNRPAKSIKAGIDNGEYSLGIEGQLVKILPNMVSFSSTLPADFGGIEFSKGQAYLDLEMTPALEAEGLARETIRRIQQMRKDMRLDVEEYVTIEAESSRKIIDAVDTWADHISRETRSKKLEFVSGPKGDYVVEWNVAGEKLVLGISSMKAKAVEEQAQPPVEPPMAREAVVTEQPEAPQPKEEPSQAPAAPEPVMEAPAPEPAEAPHGVAPAPAQEPEAAEKVSELERSFSYLVEEDRPEASYRLFMKAMASGMKGYCVTRNYPAKIRTKFDLKDTPVIWLSNVGRENSIRPKDLEKLSLSLEQFLSQSGGGIVLLDGLEYLITNNNFITVLRLIQSLRDQVAINQSILLMAVNRSTLESHQLNLLEREVDHTIQG